MNGWGKGEQPGAGRGRPCGAQRTSEELDFTQSAMEALRKIHGGVAQTNGHQEKVWSAQGFFQLLPLNVFLIEHPSN